MDVFDEDRFADSERHNEVGKEEDHFRRGRDSELAAVTRGEECLKLCVSQISFRCVCLTRHSQLVARGQGWGCNCNNSSHVQYTQHLVAQQSQSQNPFPTHTPPYPTTGCLLVTLSTHPLCYCTATPISTDVCCHRQALVSITIFRTTGWLPWYHMALRDR